VVTELPIVVIETELLTLLVGATSRAPAGLGGAGADVAVAVLRDPITDPVSTGWTIPTLPREMTLSLLRAIDSFPSAA